MQSDKSLYQADVQMVSLIKDMRQSVHDICQEHAEKKVRIEAIDGQMFEGVIVDYDENNVYIEVEDEEVVYEYEDDDEEPLPYQPVATHVSYGGDWGSPFPPYGGGFNPYQGFGPYGGYSPYSGFGPYGDENPYGYTPNPYMGGYPQGSANRPSQLSPFSGKNAPPSQVSPFAGKNAPSGQVSPFAGKGAVSPSSESPYQGLSPYSFPPPFPGPFPPPPPPGCFFCPPPPPPFLPPPPPPPPVGPVVIPPRKRRRRRRCGRKIIPLALFTLLSIVLI